MVGLDSHGGLIGANGFGQVASPAGGVAGQEVVPGRNRSRRAKAGVGGFGGGVVPLDAMDLRLDKMEGPCRLVKGGRAVEEFLAASGELRVAPFPTNLMVGQKEERDVGGLLNFLLLGGSEMSSPQIGQPPIVLQNAEQRERLGGRLIRVLYVRGPHPVLQTLLGQRPEELELALIFPAIADVGVDRYDLRRQVGDWRAFDK